MKDKNKEKTNYLDNLPWVGVAIITAISFFLTYYFHFATPIYALIWVAWLFLSLLMGYLTKQGKQVSAFAIDAKGELLKVTWPSRQETVQTTSIVMIMVAITGFVLWGIDSGMMWVIGKITHLG